MLNKKHWIILIATLALLVALTVSIIAVLFIDNDNGNNNDPDQEETETVKQKTGKKTKIKLPCITDEGEYISKSDKNKETIEGITSQAAILVDLKDGTSTAEKKADTKIYPASMTKVMTILVAVENAKDPNKKLTVTKEMVEYQEETGGSTTVKLKEGDTITVEDALYLINYHSDTMACLLIAEYIAGSEDDFVDMMNEKAEELGLEDTNFVNCTGLHDKDHYTTCREMAAIMAAALNNETAKTVITAYKKYVVNITNKNDEDRNPPIYSNWYSGRLNDNNKVSGSDVVILGGKTGYEDIPTACFVTYAENEDSGKEYVCVVVGRISDSGTKVSEKQSTTDTKTIYKNYAK